MRRAVVLLVLLAACGKSAPEHPNVLLVTIDTLRPDAIGPSTPAIHAFLAETTHFRAVHTVAPLTLPAHTSMFTGLLPAHHGIHDNVTEPLPPRDKRPFLTLAEQLHDAGYATAGFGAGFVLAAATGVASGFESYDCPDDGAHWEDERGSMPAEERVRAPVEWIRTRTPGKPWFAWVHFFDPHAPYRTFPGDAQRAPTRESDSLAVRYGGEVRRVDAAFEELLRAVPKDAIVVLASDHGEGLGEHGEPTHGPLCYGSTIDAMIAVRGGGFARGAEDRRLRSLMDIAPTLRRLCSVDAAECDGRDLAAPPHETLVAESLFTWGIHGWGQCFAVTDGEFSLVESGSSLELFDRRKDPGESSPLPLNVPSYEKLDRALERFRAGSWARGGDEGDLFTSVSAYGEMRRRVAGYLSRHENSKLLNPRDHLQAWAVLEGVPPVVALCRDRRDPVPLQGILRRLDDIQKELPESPRVDHCRAGVYAAIAEITGVPAKFRDAARAEIAAIEKGYVQEATILPAIEYCLGASDAEALRALVRILNRSPRRVDANTARALADALKQLGITDEALRAPPPR